MYASQTLDQLKEKLQARKAALSAGEASLEVNQASEQHKGPWSLSS